MKTHEILISLIWLPWIALPAFAENSPISTKTFVAQGESFPVFQGSAQIWAPAESTFDLVNQPDNTFLHAPDQTAYSPDSPLGDEGKNYENGFRMAEWIGICEYRGCVEGLANGVSTIKGQYACTKRLKGPPLNREILINFKWIDAPQGETTEEKKMRTAKMPKIGSNWIVFIPIAVPTSGGGYDTFKGSYGLQDVSEENLGQLYAIIEAHHGQTGGDNMRITNGPHGPVPYP